MRLFVYGTLKPDAGWYHLVKPYIVEDETEEGTLAYTALNRYPIFQAGGKNELPGYYLTLNMDSDLKEMWRGLDEHEGSPNHFRKIALDSDLIVYEWNFEAAGYTTQQLKMLADAQKGEIVRASSGNQG